MSDTWLEERVLVLTPTAHDAEITRTILSGAGIANTMCPDLRSLCEEAGARGAGAALITEEAVVSPQVECLTTLLRRQPPWSELPLIVLTYGGVDSSGAEMALQLLGSATLLERPVRISTLTGAVRSALSARRRQYEIRAHLATHERQAAELRQSQARLRFALEVGRLGSWDLDLRTNILECSSICKANFGRAPDACFTYEDLLEAIHPEERYRIRDAVRDALEGHGDYDVEYPVLWLDGSTHWVIVRGRAIYGEDGAPLRMTGVSLDITERKRTEEALQETGRRKDEFLAMLAHELRNPLAPILNSVAILDQISSQEERAARQRGIITRQARHMARLIDDLLDVSRITTGKIELRQAELDVRDTLHRALESTRGLIETRAHRLTTCLAPEPLPLFADPTRLEQVFTNLLNNAAKYMEPGGAITVTSRREGAWAVVRVRDTGIGISPELLPEVFDLFRQGDRSLARSEGGLGIGLTLVKKLVEMHRGSVSVASEGLGQGSEFTISLPLLESAIPAREASPPVEAYQNNHFRRRILVVDDNPDMTESIAELLELGGHHVRTASNGNHAVELAREFQPDTVLLDIGLPGKDGYQVARELREEGALAAATLIAVSGYGRDEDRDLSRKAGFDHHLVKPVDLSTLEQVLAEVTAQK